jgi:hypothetical protein
VPRFFSAISIALLTILPQSRDETAPHPSLETLSLTPSCRAISLFSSGDMPLFVDISQTSFAAVLPSPLTKPKYVILHLLPNTDNACIFVPAAFHWKFLNALYLGLFSVFFEADNTFAEKLLHPAIRTKQLFTAHSYFVLFFFLHEWVYLHISQKNAGQILVFSPVTCGILLLKIFFWRSL